MNETYNKLLVLAMVSTASLGSYAGDKGGNGGGAFICRSKDGQITRAVSYDIWDSLKVERHNRTSAQEQLSAAILRIREFNSLVHDKVVKVVAKRSSSP